MILEVAILDVVPTQCEAFEQAFQQAQTILMSMQGYITHDLKHCIEKQNRYLLLVQWANLEDHTQGFRQSADYQQWKALLHHFYEPFPVVEHYIDLPKPKLFKPVENETLNETIEDCPTIGRTTS